MRELPAKLSQDAILEAVLDIRFESNTIGEVLVGRLASAEVFAGYNVSRLPIASLPIEAREASSDLRFQPTLQLSSAKPGEIAKVGPHVISLHGMAPYQGWAEFSERLTGIAEALFSLVEVTQIVRIGLRYINAITPKHGIDKISDLQLDVKLAGQTPTSEMLFSHRIALESDQTAALTIATPSFVNGSNIPPECAAFVDIDISTPQAPGSIGSAEIMEWVERAHDAEKKIFFSLLSDDQIAKLVE